MTNRRPAIGVIIVGLLLCFLGGLLSVIVQREAAGLNPRASATPESAQLGLDPDLDRPVVTLVIGVEELVEPTPSLRAIWVITTLSATRDIYAEGIRIDMPVPEEPESSLEEIFSWDVYRGPDAIFLERLSQLSRTGFDVVIVLDRVAFETLIDFVGGVNLEGEHLDGRKVTGFLGMLAGDPVTSLQLQARILEALSGQAASLGPSPELTPLLELVPHHAYTSLRPLEIVGIFSPLLPLERERIHVIIPME
jgi:hypothetical protein